MTGAGPRAFPIARYQWGTEGGWSIFKTMEPLVEKAVASGRLTVMLNTSAVELIQDAGGAVTGVVADRLTAGAGTLPPARSCWRAAAVRPTRICIEELHGVPLYCQIAHPNSQGIGLTLGLAAGGYLRGGEKYAALPGAILANDYYPSPAHGHSGRAERISAQALGNHGQFAAANVSCRKITRA